MNKIVVDKISMKEFGRLLLSNEPKVDLKSIFSQYYNLFSDTDV